MVYWASGTVLYIKTPSMYKKCTFILFCSHCTLELVKWKFFQTNSIMEYTGSLAKPPKKTAAVLKTEIGKIRTQKLVLCKLDWYPLRRRASWRLVSSVFISTLLLVKCCVRYLEIINTSNEILYSTTYIFVVTFITTTKGYVIEIFNFK